MSNAVYRWIINKDHIHAHAKGVEGPNNADKSVSSNPADFQIADDDGMIYFEGVLYGDYDGFEPLDDFGTPAAGATQIKLNGEWL